MISNVAVNILNLIKDNTGVAKEQIYTEADMEMQKIVDLILSETRCSITDEQGNYSRLGSSTDIRIIKNLIKIFLSNTNQIPPEIVSMALRKEETFGPFLTINFKKSFDKQNNNYEIELEKIFPDDFYTNIFQNNLEIRNQFINQIVKPYVKDIIFENDVLMSKNPLGAYISKLFTKSKDKEQLINELVDILKQVLKCDDNLIYNISKYMITNIMSNKYFQTELINLSLETTELQKLGRIYSGFNSLVESMACETIRMIELKSFPYGEYAAIKNTYFTTVAVLNSLSTSFENLNENEILEKMKEINKFFKKSDGRRKKEEEVFRNKNVYTNKFGESVEIVECKDINIAMNNLCKMIKVLLDNKDNIDANSYIKEVRRIHYRYLKIKPFSNANGRTSRAIFNILLQAKGIIAIFRKDNRSEYIEWIREADKIVHESNIQYVQGLVDGSFNGIEVEDEFLKGDLPFLLVRG